MFSFYLFILSTPATNVLAVFIGYNTIIELNGPIEWTMFTNITFTRSQVALIKWKWTCTNNNNINLLIKDQMGSFLYVCVGFALQPFLFTLFLQKGCCRANLARFCCIFRKRPRDQTSSKENFDLIVKKNWQNETSSDVTGKKKTISNVYAYDLTMKKISSEESQREEPLKMNDDEEALKNQLRIEHERIFYSLEKEK